jgi:hypothetical protein
MVFIAFMLNVAVLPYLLKVLAIVLKNLAIEFRVKIGPPKFFNLKRVRGFLDIFVLRSFLD